MEDQTLNRGDAADAGTGPEGAVGLTADTKNAEPKDAAKREKAPEAEKQEGKDAAKSEKTSEAEKPELKDAAKREKAPEAEKQEPKDVAKSEKTSEAEKPERGQTAALDYMQSGPVKTVRPSADIAMDGSDYQGTGHVRIRTLEMKEISQEDIDRVLELTGQLEDFDILMMYYDCALAQVRTKLEILNREMALKKKRNPFESIKCRLKKPVSIYEKLKLRKIPFSVENIEKYLTDVAGLRVICSFIDDIYNIRDSLAAQDDVKIIQEKDYIAHPKPNGYRSLHLILEIPIFLMQEKKYMRVELQFRTIAMDFWGSVEHKMKYKKEIKNAESIVEELRYSADLINQLDRRMLQIRDRIELSEEANRVRSEWK